MAGPHLLLTGKNRRHTPTIISLQDFLSGGVDLFFNAFCASLTFSVPNVFKSTNLQNNVFNAWGRHRRVQDVKLCVVKPKIFQKD